MRRPKPSRPATFAVVAMFLGCAAATLLAEAVVRVADIPPSPLNPLPIPKYRLSDDPILRYEYRSNYVGTEADLPDFDQGWATNSNGFRDREYPRDKPAGVTRILVLGDSIVAGNGIRSAEDVFVKRLERLLNAPSGRQRYEVLNLGVGGYQTYQEVELLRVKGLAYHPDIVLVAFCLNDFDAFADGGVYDALLQLNPQFNPARRPSGFWRTATKVSRLAFLIYHRWFARGPLDTSAAHYARDVLHGKDPVTAGLHLLAQLQEANRFHALVFIVPAFDAAFSRYRYQGIHDRVKAAAQPYPHVAVIDLLSTFQAVSDDAVRFGLDNAHPNEYGHGVIAEAIVRVLRERGLI